MLPRFVLDHNFPNNIIQALGHIPEADLIPLQVFDAALIQNVEDWEILVRIHQARLDGFITSDEAMINQAKELAVLIQTRLTLVVTESVTHDPLVATGLLLIHLPHIAHQTAPARPQLWVLRAPGRKAHSDPKERLRQVAQGLGEDPEALFRRERVPGLLRATRHARN